MVERAKGIRLGALPEVLGIMPPGPIMAGVKIQGLFTADVYRDGEHLQHLLAGNAVANAGLNHILETEFRSGAQVTTWYVGLIDESGFVELANSDTLLSHAGWTEFTDYSGNRQAWAADAASGGVMTNSTTADFTFTGVGDIVGLFLASVAAGTSGVLWSTALFETEAELAASDLLRVTYTINAIRS